MTIIEIDSLVQTVPYLRICQSLSVSTRWHFRLTRGALRISLLQIVELLLLLEEVTLPHLHLLLLEVLEVQLLFLLR